MLAHVASSLGNALPGGGSLPIEYLGSETFSTPGSITGAPPASATHVRPRLWGGGASGAGRISSSLGALSGASAAAFNTAFTRITGAVTGTVGAGGAKIANGTTASGNAGSDTTVSVNGAIVATAPGATAHSNSAQSVATLVTPGTVDADVQALLGGLVFLPSGAPGMQGRQRPTTTDGSQGGDAYGFGGGLGGVQGDPDGKQPGGGGASASSGAGTTTYGKGGDGRIILDYFRIAT